MIAAISGTPGTGKTAVVRELARLTGWRVVRLSAVARTIPTARDAARDTRIVSIPALQRAVRVSGDAIIEGHLAHLLDSDLTVVLRCNPAVLRKRLERKGWRAAKIRENVEAELVDVITAEALERHGARRIAEVDTSRRTPGGTARLIRKLLNNIEARQAYRPGRIDWAGRYKNAVR